MRRCLVVANQTLGGERLHEEIRRLVRDGPCRFHIVVPATSSVPEGPTGSVPERPMGPDAHDVAERRLESVLSRLHGMGILATGEVCDGDPEVTVSEARLEHHFDEVILPTLPV
jgi:hypothetical protein